MSAKQCRSAALKALHAAGMRSAKDCLIIADPSSDMQPALTICLLYLRSKKPQGKYVLWSRIDKEPYFKGIKLAGE